MTIQKEDPGVWVAYCDHKGCASRIEIDCDCDDSFSEAATVLAIEHEWERFKIGEDWFNWCTDHEMDLEDVAKAGARG